MNSRTHAGAPVMHTRDINVTPMIDVLLVLLIIFLAAIPDMRRGIDVQLPEQDRQSTPDGPSIVLEIDREGVARINRALVAEGELAGRLRAVYDGRPDKVLFVRADPHLRYSAVIDAMDVARGAGVRVIGLP